jgi:hypothetical protein
MSRVNGVSFGATVGGSRRKPAATAGGFDVTEGVETAASLPETAIVQPPGLVGMLALQEAEAQAAGVKNAKRHASALLDALRELQHGLLSETEDKPENIARLARLFGGAPAVADPQLADLLAAIRLRARIELLRRGAETG